MPYLDHSGCLRELNSQRWLVYSNITLMLADALPDPNSLLSITEPIGEGWYMAASREEALECLGCCLLAGWQRGHLTAPRQETASHQEG